MAFIHPFDHEYADYVRLARSLRHDGVPVEPDDAREGDFLYVSDGPRIITEIGKSCEPGSRQVCIDDTGGPTTGGWTVIRTHKDSASSGMSKRAWRGGQDHFRARADSAEAELRRWQKRTGRKHP